MEQLFVLLYPLVAIISIISYAPQIIKLIYAEKSCEVISLSSWLGWTISGALSLGYGIFHLKDLMFSITAGIGLFMIILTVILIIYNRHGRFRESAS